MIIGKNPKKRARYIWPKWRRNYHAQQSKNASPWAYFGWGFVILPGERRGAQWAPRSDFLRDFASGNRKIFGSRCQKTSKKPASELSAIPRKTREAS